MKLKYILIFPLLISCIGKQHFKNEKFIDTESFTKQDTLNLYRYISNDFRNYLSIHNEIKKLDSFKPIMYCNVMPLEENKKKPQKIFTYQTYYKDSKVYFSENLKGKSISYLQKNDAIVFRHFFQDYNDVSQEDKHPRNELEVLNYLNKKKLHIN